MTGRIAPVASVVFGAAAVLAACSSAAHHDLAGAPPPPRPPLPPLDPEDVPRAAPAPPAEPEPEPEPDAGAPAATGPCPAGMVYVDTTYCPRPKLHCKKSEYDKPNHITICHEFEPGQACAAPLRRERFCIDRYEYPNREGAHPPVMVSFHDAAALCAERHARLCWESEWVSACEGPDKLPFPYGLARDKSKCNIDNPYLRPDLARVYSSDPRVQAAELSRLDQSAPSGARAGCVSGFGVHDLTGNVDEWVQAESRHDKSQWAGLKGGAWGHVRNACRPMTVSHAPEFTYYFVSFRCCADAAPDAEAERDPTLWRPPPSHAFDGAKATFSRGVTPSR